MMKYIAFASLTVLAACQDEEMVDLDELKERTLGNLIYVASGTFMPGNYEVKLRGPDGEIETRRIGVIPNRDVAETTLQAFYIQSHLPTVAEYVTFRNVMDLPLLQTDRMLEGVASMPFHEAEAYCVWLGELTGLSMRLPTENEWEFAARSRVLSPPFGTDNGNWEPPRNIWRMEDGDNRYVARPIPGDRPPNPMGLHDLHGTLDQWVSDRSFGDAKNVRIAKGSGFRETGYELVIPSRAVHQPTSREILEALPTLEPLFPQDADFIFDASATARCVVDVADPPSITGFGQEIEVASDALPEVFDAYVP